MTLHILHLPPGLLEAILYFAEPCDAAALFLTCKAAVLLRGASQQIWRAWCIRRWGKHAAGQHAELGSASSACSSTSSSEPALDYAHYYAFRCSTWSPPTSPLGLFQEEAGRDPWRLIASCVLSSRTSGGPKIWATLSSFFTAYPTPSDVIEGASTTAGLALMAAMLHPLGLNRERTIPRTAAGFLSPSWGHHATKSSGHTPSDLVGCGPFTRDSWTVFCHGGYKGVARDAKADKTVRAYAQWCVAREEAHKAKAGSKRKRSAGTKK